MEISHSTPELPKFDPHGPWRSPEQFESFVQSLDTWAATLKEELMESDPDRFDELEPLVDNAREITLEYALREDPKTEKYFRLRFDLLRRTENKVANNAAPAPLSNETLPSQDASVAEETSPSFPSPEIASVSSDTVASATIEYSTDAPVARDAKLERLLAFQEKLKQARAGASTPASSAPSSDSLPEEPKKVSSLSDLKELFPGGQQASSSEELNERVPHSEPSPAIEAPAESLEMPEDLPAPLPQDPKKEENSSSVETISEPSSPVQEKGEESKTERRRNEIRDLIKEGRGREIPLGVLLTYLSVDGVREHLEERYEDVLSGKEPVAGLRRSDLFLLYRHASPEVGKLVLAEIQRHPEWIPRTLPGEAERAIVAINEGHGATIPEGVLYRNAFYPEIARYLEQRGLAAPSERPIPPASDPQPSSLEARMQKSIESGAFDLTLATGPQLNALLRHSALSVQERAREELLRREAAPGRDPDAPLVTPEYDAWENEKRAGRSEQKKDPSEGKQQHLPDNDLPPSVEGEEVAYEDVMPEPLVVPEVPELSIDELPALEEVTLTEMPGTSDIDEPRSDPYWSAVERQTASYLTPTFGEEKKEDVGTQSDPYWAAVHSQLERNGNSATLDFVSEQAKRGEEIDLPFEEDPVSLDEKHDDSTLKEEPPTALEGEILDAIPKREEETSKEEPLTLEGELASPPSENKEEKEKREPTPEERWNALSPEDKKAFVGECEFFFTPGKSYRISETEDARLVRFLPDTGEALMVLPDGSERAVSLFALHPLNTFEGSIEEEDSAEVSEEDLTHKWIKTMQEGAGLVDVPGFEAGELINLPDGTPGWRVFGLSVAEGMVLVGLLSEDGEKIAEERKISLEEFRAHNVVSRESTPPKKEKPVEPEDRMMQEFVREQFKETFGIDEEALLAIPEFAALSPGRQLLVHNELNNYAVTQIKADALVAYRERAKTSHVTLSAWEKKLSEGKGVFGAFGKLAVGVSQLAKHATERVGNSLFKKKIVTDYEKQFAKDFSEGKFDPKEFIRDLSMQAAEGPEAIIDKDRKVKLRFLNVRDIEGGVTGEEARMIAEFNAAAEQFASTPHQWTERGATKEERASYAMKEEAYRSHLDRVLEVLRSHGDDASALLDVNELDRRITFTQFFNTHPEAAVQLAQLRDQSSILAFMKSAAVERGGLMAFGAGVRTVAAVAVAPIFAGATLVAAPLVGAISGGVMGRRRASGELEEREILAKRGVRDTSAEAQNIVSSGRRKNKEGIDRNGLTGKLEELIREIEATADDEVDTLSLVRQEPSEDGARGAIRAEGDLGATLDATSPLVESGRTITRNKRAQLLAELDRRIEYTQVKIDKGLIDFGDKKEQIKNRYALLRALASAKALRAQSLAPELDVAVDEKGDLYDNTWRTDRRSASERLEDILRLREQKITEAQKTYVQKTARRAALYGASFAFGGALVADLAQGDGSVVRRVVEDVMNDNAPEVAGTAATVAGITPRAPSSLGQEVVPPTMKPIASAESLATPPSVGAPVSPEAIERALREGWSGGLVEKAREDALFNGDMVRGYTMLAQRAEGTGLSQVEYNALLASQGKPAFKELMDAMRASPETLPDAKVAEIMVRNGMPTSLESVVPPPALSAGEVGAAIREAASPVLESIHGVEQGETLTSIMRELPSLKGLSSSAQDNVIQNFLHRASDAELLSIGVDDPSRLSLGQAIDLAKLNEILATKRIGDSSLIEHAKQLFGGEEVTPVSDGALANEAIGQASAPAVAPETVAPSAPNTAPTAPTPASGAPVEAILPEPPKAIPPVETAPSPRAIPLETTEAPTAATSVVETVLTPREIERMASEQLVKNMTDPITKDPLPLWLEMRRYNAYDVIRVRQDEVTPEVWQKVEWVRQYLKREGLDRDDLIPGKQESVDQFLRRGHAKVIELGEVKDVKPMVPLPPATAVPQTGANIPPPVIRQPAGGVSSVSPESRVTPTLSRPRPDDAGFTPRSIFTDTTSTPRGATPPTEVAPSPTFKPRTLPKW